MGSYHEKPKNAGGGGDTTITGTTPNLDSNISPSTWRGYTGNRPLRPRIQYDINDVTLSQSF
jgi:hypothetical protein